MASEWAEKPDAPESHLPLGEAEKSSPFTRGPVFLAVTKEHRLGGFRTRN